MLKDKTYEVILNRTRIERTHFKRSYLIDKWSALEDVWISTTKHITIDRPKDNLVQQLFEDSACNGFNKTSIRTTLWQPKSSLTVKHIF